MGTPAQRRCGPADAGPALAAVRAGVVAVLAALTLAGSATPARADGLRRLDAAWLIPARQLRTAVGGRHSPAAAGFWLRAGQTRLYGLPELPVRLFALGLAGRDGRWAAEGAWEIAGSDALRDDRVVGRLVVGDRLRVGLRAGWRRLQPGPGLPGRARDLALEFGAAGRAGPVGEWDARVRLPLARAGDGWLHPEPDNRLHLSLAAPGRALALTLDLAADGRPAVGWEALCSVGSGLGMSWRADRVSGAMGGGFVWWRGRLRLRSSHLAHPELGLTHRLEVALGASTVSPW